MCGKVNNFLFCFFLKVIRSELFLNWSSSAVLGCVFVSFIYFPQCNASQVNFAQKKENKKKINKT